MKLEPLICICIFYGFFDLSFLRTTILGGNPLKLLLDQIHKRNCSTCTMIRSNPLQKLEISNKSTRKPKRCYSYKHCKGQFIHQLNPTLFSPKSYNLVCRTCTILLNAWLCVLHGTPVLGAICACQERSSKGIWTLQCQHTKGADLNFQLHSDLQYHIGPGGDQVVVPLSLVKQLIGKYYNQVGHLEVQCFLHHLVQHY